MNRRGFLFESVKVTKPKYSQFDLSYENRFSTQFGALVPSALYEVIPGDIFDMQTSAYVQAAPMTAPAMQRMDMFIYNFFIPARILCVEFDDFISNGNGKVKMKDQSSWQAPIMPYFTFSQAVYNSDSEEGISVLDINGNTRHDVNCFTPGSLADFLGVNLPKSVAPLASFPNNIKNFQVSALPFRAYQMIYNYYFRDQNLEDEVEVNTSSGAVTTDELESILSLRYKCWEKDYFTSALPMAQRGAPVQMPIDVQFGSGGSVDLSGIAPQIGAGIMTNDADTLSLKGQKFDMQITPVGHDDDELFRGVFNARHWDGQEQIETNKGFQLGGFVNGHANGSLVNSSNQSVTSAPVNLDSVHATSSTTIEDLRHAFKLQEWLEKSARFGSRIVESILGHFGERVPDYRVDKPEFLSSTRIPIGVSAVNQTSATLDDSTPQAYKAGQASGSGNGARFSRKFVEHGYIMQLCAIMPRSSYSQGIPRMYTRKGFEDYAWPEFDQLGEQEIRQHELSMYYPADGGNFDPDSTFGYTPRYAEYKYHPDEAHGDFQPGESLAYWTASRDLRSNHVLNDDFVKFQPGDANGIFAVESNDYAHFYVDMWHSTRAIRHLHEYGTPTF